jgi:ketosteroid isomerase-like protein
MIGSDSGTVSLREDRTRLFQCLGDPATVPRFFDRVAEDVTWTVEGTHPLAGTFTSKTHFVQATFGRLGRLMRDDVHLALLNLFIDGDTTIAELQAGSTTLDGAPYDNRLCWVCRFAGFDPTDLIVEVHAYLDSAMVSWTVERNEARTEDPVT